MELCKRWRKTEGIKECNIDGDLINKPDVNFGTQRTIEMMGIKPPKLKLD